MKNIRLYTTKRIWGELYGGLFDKPVFLKGDSDAKEYTEKLKLLKSKASDQLVQRLDKEIPSLSPHKA